MSVARQIVKSALAGVLPRHRFLVKGPVVSTQWGPSDVTEIALTFDDGPHPAWTPAVLDELSRVGWKGTFFVIGERAAEHPDLLRRIVDEGHALGNHTYTHSAPNATTPQAFLNEVQRTHDLIESITGISTSLMRPPLGKLNWGKFRGLWRQQQSIILWNRDPKDFAMCEESECTAWMQSYHPQSGDVVLLHDRLRYASSIVRAISQRFGDHIRAVSLLDWFEARPDGQAETDASHAVVGARLL